jgi:hypothetical protein
MERNLCNIVIQNGGSITPLIIPSSETDGMGLMNPSIFIDNDKILVNLRHINYTLYHSENNQQYQHRWGPLVYINPENDIHLKTKNFLCTLNNNLEIEKYSLVDTTKLDIIPKWEFHGLEDARVVRWDKKLYLTGVRRDTTDNGEGRMELSEVIFKNNKVKEISRLRIPAPSLNNSYCEKNWMPILDMPFHYMKWVNSTEVVKVDIDKKTCETVFLSEIPMNIDLRGGSQIIPYGNYRICITHEVNLYNNKLGQKDGKYFHRFVVWDKNWKIVKVSDAFSFMTGEIEFCCGLTHYKNDLLITFGFQDNVAYLLKMPTKFFESYIGLNNKLENFPPIYYVSYITSNDRRIELEKQFIKYGLTNWKSIISTEESDKNNIINGLYLEQLPKTSIACTTSHLKAIKDWYNNSDTSYAIFLEDDVSLETVEYWNFTWNDFMNNLPSDWECIQLTCIRDNLTEVKLKERVWDDWSITSYIINRKYAKQLIDEYYSGEEFNLVIKDTNLQPIPENIIYFLGKTYSIPLFIENINFESIHLRFEKNKIDKKHIDSSNFVLKWWMENGKNVDIKNIDK